MDNLTTANKNQKTTLFANLLRIRDFRLLWIGQGISSLGDQFYFIALPWLVLQLTGDALAMSTVLALESVPRALFMLIGGALTDRFSSRALMLTSDLLRLVLVMLLTGLVLAGRIEIWMLYVFAISFGLVDAFFYPALNAMLPHLVEQNALQMGNALLQGTSQLAMFAGPVLAGAMIALLDGGAAIGSGVATAVHDTVGNGIAFGFDALTFFVSVVTLWMMRSHHTRTATQTAGKGESVLSSLREGLAYVARDPTLRVFFLITAAVTVLINGPFTIGVPVLAETRFPEGAAAFGIIVSALGGGALVGTVIAGVSRPAPSRLGPTLLLVTGSMGIGLALIGVTPSTMIAAAISLAMGIANGYVVILFTTWLQSRTPAHMLGRMMSLLMFALVGLNPVSTALSGALAKLDATLLFAGAGSLLVVITLVSLLSPTLRAMGIEANAAAAPAE